MAQKIERMEIDSGCKNKASINFFGTLLFLSHKFQ